MLKFKVNRFAVLVTVCALLTAGCGVKQYKPGTIKKPVSWVKIDGSESRKGIPVFGSKYATYLHLWRFYPDTCEAYYRGAIEARKNRNSKQIPIPAEVPTYIYAAREKSGGGGYSQYHFTDALNVYFVPKDGVGYVFTVKDRDRDFFDISVDEVTDDGVRPLEDVAAENFGCEDGFKTLKRLKVRQ